MIKVSIVGCTGKLGSTIMEAILKRQDIQLIDAITREGNPYSGKDISIRIGGNATGIRMIDSITQARPCDVFIDCTPAESFLEDNAPKYILKGKPVVVASTGFDEEGYKKLRELATHVPVLQSGNFSITLYEFIETLKFAVQRISDDTDIQIIEYHHNQKKDAPSGTAKMIQEALIQANKRFNEKNLKISSIRGGNILGEHRVVLANCSDEVMEYRHHVSSRAAFTNGAIELALWLSQQQSGFYHMEDFITSRRKTC